MPTLFAAEGGFLTVVQWYATGRHATTNNHSDEAHGRTSNWLAHGARKEPHGYRHVKDRNLKGLACDLQVEL